MKNLTKILFTLALFILSISAFEIVNADSQNCGSGSISYGSDKSNYYPGEIINVNGSIFNNRAGPAAMTAALYYPWWATAGGPTQFLYSTNTVTLYGNTTFTAPSTVAPYTLRFTGYCRNQTPFTWDQTINVLSPSVATPDLKVSANDYFQTYTNVDGPITITSGVVYTVSWGSVANATSCTLNGSAASSSGGSISDSSAKTYTLICNGPNNSSASDSVTINYPPAATGFNFYCNADSTVARLYWDANSYNNNTFYVRGFPVNDPGNYWGVGGIYQDGYVGTTYAVAISPNTAYQDWVHVQAPNGPYGPASSATVYCPRSDGYWSDYGGWSACSVTACGQTGTQYRSRTCTQPTGGGAACQGSDTDSRSCSTSACITAVDGGWTAWPAVDNTCGSTFTVNRSCTNPQPAYGGKDCSLIDGGNTSKTYTNPPCPPVVTGPVSLYKTMLQAFGFTTTNPNYHRIEYGIDWNMDGFVDNWIPLGFSYSISGATQFFANSCISLGLKQFQALSQDEVTGVNSSWTPYSVNVIPLPPPAVVSVFATPSTVIYGDKTKITWSSTDSTSCISDLGGSNNNPNNLVDGVYTPALKSRTTFKVTCTGPGGTGVGSVSVMVTQVKPTFKEF